MLLCLFAQNRMLRSALEGIGGLKIKEEIVDRALSVGFHYFLEVGQRSDLTVG
jgi:hypothetical protein